LKKRIILINGAVLTKRFILAVSYLF